MATETLKQIILGLYVDQDGKDENTALNASINLADCTQIAYLDLTSWKLDKPGDGNRQKMDLDAMPTRKQMEAGTRLRFRWSPSGRDSFDGHAIVEVEYDDSVKRSFAIKNVKFDKEKEWYIFPLSGSGDNQ
jgi:hypothetical protein